MAPSSASSCMRTSRVCVGLPSIPRTTAWSAWWDSHSSRFRCPSSRWSLQAAGAGPPRAAGGRACMALVEPEQARPGWGQLLRSFGTIGVTSMGGGRFTYFYHEFAQRRRWLTDAEMLDALALSQVLPGPNIGNLSILLGARLRGARGALLALVAVLAPGALAMLVLSALYFSHGHLPSLLPVFKGIGAAAAGLAT